MGVRGQTVMVTGANSGIGRATALALAGAGAKVVMVCRHEGRGQEALEYLLTHSGNPDVHLLVADLGSQKQLREAVRTFGERFDHLDCLINNAGASFPNRQLTADGDESTFGVNVLGPYFLSELLLPHLRASAAARIVNLVGLYHKRGKLDLADLEFEGRGYSHFEAANAAQLARMMWTVDLARRLDGSDVTVNAVHPGAALTQLQSVLPWHVRLLARTILRPGFTSPEKAARPVLRLVGDPQVAGVSGAFFNKHRRERPVPAARDSAAAGALFEIVRAKCGLA